MLTSAFTRNNYNMSDTNYQLFECLEKQATELHWKMQNQRHHRWISPSHSPRPKLKQVQASIYMGHCYEALFTLLAMSLSGASSPSLSTSQRAWWQFLGVRVTIRTAVSGNLVGWKIRKHSEAAQNKVSSPRQAVSSALSWHPQGAFSALEQSTQGWEYAFQTHFLPEPRGPQGGKQPTWKTLVPLAFKFFQYSDDPQSAHTTIIGK